MASHPTRTAPWVFATVLLFAPLLLAAQPAFLVRDLVSDFEFPQGGPTGFVSGLRAVGGHLYFSATGEGTEKEVWVSDGTPAGTDVLRDLCPGWCEFGLELAGALGDVVLWSEQTGSGQIQLWRSNGRQAGTYPLSDDATVLNAPSAGGSSSSATFQGAHYFAGCPAGRGLSDCDLWRTDGTPAGTRRLRSIGASFGWMQATADRLFFLTANGRGWDLWSSDGTEAGTFRLRTVARQREMPTSPVGAGDRLFFLANASSGELWTSDGTPAGTLALTGFAQRGRFPAISPWLKGEGGQVYFTADDGAHGWELWSSDGTPVGTRRRTNFRAWNPFSTLLPSALAEIGGSVVFAADAGDGAGRQLFVNRGAKSSALLVHPGCPGCGLRPDGALVVSGGKGFFVLSKDFGSELWATDGTSAGSLRVADLCAAGECSILDLEAWQGGVLFRATFGDTEEIGSADGTAGGARPFVRLTGRQVQLDSLGVVALRGRAYFLATVDQVAGLWVREADGRVLPVRTLSGPLPTSLARPRAVAGERLLFSAAVGNEDGLEPWLSGGIAATTERAETAGRTFAFGSEVAESGGLAYLQLNTDIAGSIELWRTDGTGAGTFSLATFEPQIALTPWRGGLTYFPGREIWATDGTVAGTRRTGDLPEELRVVTGASPAPDGLYLQTVTAPGSSQIWISDGTTSGTRQLSRFTQTGLTGWRARFTPVGGTVYFSWADGLWRSDGTAAGTVHLQSLPLYENPTQMAAWNGGLLYLTESPEPTVGCRLWWTDGTPMGSVELAAFPAQDTLRNLPVRLLPFGGKIYLNVDDGAHGIELWSTDGTRSGTGLAFDLVPGPGSSRPGGLLVVGSRFYFSASDPRHGQELWVSDGTRAGTRLVHDIAPQAGSSSPEDLTLVGDQLFFTADDGVTGRELWVLPLAPSGGCVPSANRLCLQGGRYAVEGAWRDALGIWRSGGAAPLTPDTGTFWFSDPANVEAVLKVLDGTGVNGHQWVFYGALSNVEYTLTVTDTQTGLAHRYRNPPGNLASVGDTHAFGQLGASRAAVSTTTAANAALTLASRKVVPRAATGVCAPSSTRLCLSASRYAVEVAWKDFAGHTGTGQANGLSADTGWFWFFDPANVELVLKVLDGTPVNGHRWVFYGALSSVEYTVTVTDTQTGEVRTYRNPSGQLASVADTAAF